MCELRRAAAQLKAMKQVCGGSKPELAQYYEVAASAQSGAADPDAATQYSSNCRARPNFVPKQPQYSPLPIEKKLWLFMLLSKVNPDQIPIPIINQYEQEQVY
uniref:ATP synthase alpha subunit C-terminal domain-containing protein n=1 Tax=Phlegmariurus squarrosus TaxID=73615 RepID=H9M862_PHLSQ|nr:hypothetical protein HusqMp81 [Phlegmariurus squarrosus]AEV55769.1 hypothetical protein HusqMp81 [Phlegmariurus squarrosus]